MRSDGPRVVASCSRTLASLLVALVALATACGDDDATSDGGAGTDAGPSVAIDPPIAPAPPVLEPCPAGWRAVSSPGDPAHCEPWPEAGRAACADDEVHMPGEPGCTRIGTACAPDGWPPDLPSAARVIFVDPAAPLGGAGTRDAPMADVGDAIARASPGTIVALAAGTYTERVTVPSGVTLWGACVAGTALRGTLDTGGSGRVTVSGRDVVVRNLQVGGPRTGIWIQAGASAHVEDVLVSRSTYGGITVLGEATARTVVVRDVEPAPDGRFGRGVHVENGVARFSRFAVERAAEAGLVVKGPMATLEADGIAIVGTRSQPSDRLHGYGIVAHEGSQSRVVSAVIEGNRATAVNAGQLGTLLVLEDAVVRDTLANEADGLAGNGAFVGGGARLEARRVLFERSRSAHLVSYLEGSTLVLEDVVARDAIPRESDGAAGIGMSVHELAVVTARRLWIARSSVGGVMGYDRASLSFEDLVVRDVAGQSRDGLGGSGVVVDLSSSMALARASIERAHMLGLFAGEASVVDATDVVIADTESQPANGVAGRGIEAIAGARVSVERVVLARNRGSGASAFGVGTEIHLAHALIEATAPMRCDETICAGRGRGFGLTALDGYVSASHFRIANNDLCGVQIARGGAVDLAFGEIVGHPIGMNVQSETWDPARAMNVTMRDNERNLDVMTLPLPDPSPPPIFGE